jgi:hypothetical protein
VSILALKNWPNLYQVLWLMTKLNTESSTNVVDILYSYFCYKKNKFKWVGSLKDSKAVVLNAVDEEITESTTWRSNMLLRCVLPTTQFKR